MSLDGSLPPGVTHADVDAAFGDDGEDLDRRALDEMERDYAREFPCAFDYREEDFR